MQIDAEDLRYCEALAKQGDEDRWLAVGYADQADHARLLALYAFLVELRRIPGAVSEPPLGEIRLQWWRDALEEIRQGKAPRAHPVVGALAGAGLAGPDFAGLIETLIGARARLLYDAPFANLDELLSWLGDVEGAGDALAARLLGADEDYASRAQEAGAAFALAREGARFGPALKSEIAARLPDLIAQSRAALGVIPSAIAPALLHLALSSRYARGRGRNFSLFKRVRLLTAATTGRV